LIILTPVRSDSRPRDTAKKRRDASIDPTLLPMSRVAIAVGAEQRRERVLGTRVALWLNGEGPCDASAA
jgi:hypothetical protein